MTSEYLQLKTANCRHCYKCIRNCPVKAISFADDQATIMQETCVLCGRCFVFCPQNAKQIRDDLPAAKALVASGAEVVASLAPSFIANFGGAGLGSVAEGLEKLGIQTTEETAIGATIVKARYAEMLASGEHDVLISSCCHTVNMLIQRHFPAALPHLAPVLSPMLAHCADIKRRRPAAKTIFIGPCISKKAEAEQYPGTVDCVLTFDELAQWFEEAGVWLEFDGTTGEGGRARLFPTTGGILRSMKDKPPAYNYAAVDGMDNCIAALEDIEQGRLEHCFIEMSACAGSCIGGPVMGDHCGLVSGFAAVDNLPHEGEFAVEMPKAAALEKSMPYDAPGTMKHGEKAIAEVLRKIGKTKPEDELNCGSCGYETCREKAEAVLAGKADLTMCLPYLMSKAQSFSDTIIQNTPNGIVVLDEELTVQQVNTAACRMLGIKDAAELEGHSVVGTLDPSLFLEVLEDRHNLYEKQVHLEEHDRYLRLNVVYDEENELIIGTMRDVTEAETAFAARRQMNEATIAVADRVIDNQMRTVQEIASLLGETAAETKIALTKLKETLTNE